jgi:DedD protein
MASHIEVPDLAVDELKRRARRRLVGAVVLALAAAVILPLLLESDPKPLGSDVSIQIPPIDNSKFVTPLSPAKDAPVKALPDARSDAKGNEKGGASTDGKSDAIASPQAAAPVTPASAQRGLVEAEQRVLGQGSTAKATATAPPISDTKAAAPGAVSTTTPLASSDIKAAPDARPAPTAALDANAPSEKAQAVAEAKSASPAAGAAGAFQIQLAALSDVKAAGELAKKVKASGFAVRTEEVPTRKGTVQRVRVGPFATRAAADTALAKLKSLGYGNPQVIAAK